MGSIDELIKAMPRISVDVSSGFVVEYTKDGQTIFEGIILAKEIEFNHSTGKSKLLIDAIVPQNYEQPILR